MNTRTQHEHTYTPSIPMYIALKCSFIQQIKWICYITSFGVMVHNGEICRL